MREWSCCNLSATTPIGTWLCRPCHGVPFSGTCQPEATVIYLDGSEMPSPLWSLTTDICIVTSRSRQISQAGGTPCREAHVVNFAFINCKPRLLLLFLASQPASQCWFYRLPVSTCRTADIRPWPHTQRRVDGYRQLVKPSPEIRHHRLETGETATASLYLQHQRAQSIKSARALVACDRRQPLLYRVLIFI